MRKEGTHDVPAEVSFHFRHREGPVATTCSFEVLTEASQHVPCTCHTLLDETICVECDIASEAWTSLKFNVECQLGLSSLPRLTLCEASLAWFGVQLVVFYLASRCLSSVGMSSLPLQGGECYLFCSDICIIPTSIFPVTFTYLTLFILQCHSSSLKLFYPVCSHFCLALSICFMVSYHLIVKPSQLDESRCFRKTQSLPMLGGHGE